MGLRWYNSTESRMKAFQSWLRANEIINCNSPAYSPKSNSKADLVQQTIMSTTTCLIGMVKHIPNHNDPYDETMMTSNFLRNRMYRTFENMEAMRPFKAFTGKKTEISGLRFFWIYGIPSRSKTQVKMEAVCRICSWDSHWIHSREMLPDLGWDQ